jgi:thioredoxin
MRKIASILLLALVAGSFCNAQSAAGAKAVVKPTFLTKENFASKVADISKAEWKYVGDKPALIDFYADWCGPCRTMIPILEDIATKYRDQLYVYKIDTEAERELAAMFRVRAIPYMLLVPMQQPPQYMEGAMPQAYLEEVIKTYLLKEAKEGE